jgi:hypothetical protein
MRRFSQFAFFTVVSSLLFVHAAAQAQLGNQYLATNLGSVNLGASTTAPVTLTFPADGTISSISVVTQGATGLDFTNAGTGGSCMVGAAYTKGQTCTVAVTFKPLFGGMRFGAVVAHSATDVLVTTYLVGTGTGPQIAFSPSKTIAFDPPIQGRAGSKGLSTPQSVAVDGSGTLYVTTSNANGIVEIPAGGTPFVFEPTVNGVQVGNVTSIAVDGAGNLYMAESSRVVEIRPNGSALEFEDSNTNSPNITAIAVDGNGDLFMADATDNLITEFGGLYGLSSVFPNQQGEPYPAITAMAVDSAGDIYFAFNGSGSNWSILGYTQLLAFNGDTFPITLTINGSALGSVSGIAFDGAGNTYFSYPPAGIVEIPASNSAPFGAGAFIITPSANGTALQNPVGLAVDATGNLFVADSGNNRVAEFERSQAPALSFASTPVGQKSPDSPQTVLVQNIGTGTLIFSEVNYPVDFPMNTAGSNPCEVSTMLASGHLCNLSIDFVPNSPSNFNESVTLKDNSGNVSGTQQSVTASGTGNSAFLSAYTLAFGVEEVGTESASQQVTLTNNTNATLHITGIQVTGPNASSFVFGSNCPSSLTVGVACTIHGHFAPTTTGPLTAAVTITDNATGSPQRISLTGTGEASSAISLSASNLAFGGQNVGTESTSQQVILTNATGAMLRIVGIQVTGANASSFVFGSDCPSSLASGAACTIHGHFAPTTTGPLTAAVTIVDNATGSPQSISLTGTGGARPAISLSANNISFGLQHVGTQSASQQLILTNTGGSALSVVGITVMGTNASSFVFGSNCPSSLAAGASCIIHGHFAPTGTGAMTAAVLIVDNASNSPQMIGLTGTGD